MLDTSFLVLVAISLGFMSLLVGIRLRVAGAAPVQIVTAIAEMWAVFATWIALLTIATRNGQGYEAAWSWFVTLSPGGKALTGTACVFSLAIFVHLQWRLRRELGTRD